MEAFARWEFVACKCWYWQSLHSFWRSGIGVTQSFWWLVSRWWESKMCHKRDIKQYYRQNLNEFKLHCLRIDEQWSFEWAICRVSEFLIIGMDRTVQRKVIETRNVFVGCWAVVFRYTDRVQSVELR